MARNTSISGSNNFRWNIGDSNTASYVDKPILREFWGDDRCSDQFVTFFELLDLGSFQNFGFINFDSTSLGIKSFIKLISDQLVYLDKKLKGENPSLPSLTIEETNNTGDNTNVDTSKYYWYIGVDNPSSISNIQTDNTVAGWHEIGSSLSGFVFDTNNNPVHISETRVPYYVIIPNDLHIYNGLNMNIESITFETITCNITGYKSLKYIPSGGSTGVRDVKGIIIK